MPTFEYELNAKSNGYKQAEALWQAPFVQRP